MKKILCFLLLIGLPLFVGCNQELQTPPELNIQNVGDELEVVRGGYEWRKTVNWFETEVELADAASPEQIAQQLEGDRVAANTTLSLNFTEAPDKVSIVVWSDQIQKQLSATPSQFTVPSEAGTYVIELIGEWGQGQVSYTVKLIVDMESPSDEDERIQRTMETSQSESEEKTNLNIPSNLVKHAYDQLTEEQQALITNFEAGRLSQIVVTSQNAVLYDSQYLEQRVTAIHYPISRMQLPNKMIVLVANDTFEVIGLGMVD